MRYGVAAYFAGALLARLSDEMDGQILLLISLAVSHRVALGADVLAALTGSAAVGGPLLGAVLDRTPRPGRVLAAALIVYAVGFGLLAVTLGHIGRWESLTVAVVAGSLTSAITGGWSPRPGIRAGCRHVRRRRIGGSRECRAIGARMGWHSCGDRGQCLDSGRRPGGVAHAGCPPPAYPDRRV